MIQGIESLLVALAEPHPNGLGKLFNRRTVSKWIEAGMPHLPGKPLRFDLKAVIGWHTGPYANALKMASAERRYERRHGRPMPRSERVRLTPDAVPTPQATAAKPAEWEKTPRLRPGAQEMIDKFAKDFVSRQR